MKSQKTEVVHSTQFFPLSDSEVLEHRKRKKLLYALAISISLLFCVKAGYFCYKAIFISFHSSDGNNSSSGSVPQIQGTRLQNQKTPFSVFTNNPWASLVLKKRIRNENLSGYSEIWCEYGNQSQAIPDSIISSSSKRALSRTMQDFMALDLLLYYERIINEYGWPHLKIIFNDYHQRLVSIKKGENLVEFFKSLKSNKFKYYAAYLKENGYRLKLETFRNCFYLTDELYHWYNYLDNFRLFLLNPKRQKFRKYFRADVGVKNFDKFTTETQTKLLKPHYSFEFTEKKAEEINQLLNEWTWPVKIIINGTSIIFNNKALLLSEVKTKLNTLNFSKIENVYIFASHTLYLDEDLTLFGLNLAIIAPNWVFSKKIKINLNGLNGAEHENKTPKQGEPGKPGRAGGNAGDFFAVGNINRKYLLVSSDGGHGGGGQNGAKGQDGVNSSFPSFSKNSNCRVKINTLYNPPKQKITHYKIFEERGCGGPGTDGGVGGMGGKGGKIIIINKNLEISEGRNGSPGKPGKGGAGGVGGLNGCYFEAFVVDDEILHCITTIKCGNDTLPSGNGGKDDSNSVGQEFGHNKNNLNLSDALFEFVVIAGEEFLKSNNSVLVSFLSDLSKRDFIYTLIDPSYLVNEFKLVDIADDTELLLLFKNKIDGYGRLPWYHNWKILNYLKSLTLGKLSLLQENDNYYFIDLKSYLNTLRRNIESVNENAVAGYSPVTPLNKKVDLKLNKITKKLGSLKDKLVILEKSNSEVIKLSLRQHNAEAVLEDDFYKRLADRIQERRILFVASMATNIFLSFVNLTSHPVNAEDELSFRNFVTSELTAFENLKGNKNFFDSASSPRFKQTAGSYDDFERYLTIESRISRNLEALTNVDLKTSQSREIVEAVTNDLRLLAETNSLRHEVRILMEAIIDEIEHFIILHRFLERYELRNSFLTSLNRLELDDSDDEEVRFLRRRIYEVVVTYQYNLAVDAIQQRLYPFVKINRHLELHSNRTIADEALLKIDSLYELSKLNSLCANHHDAFFDGSSAVGEFYYWQNAEIKNKLIQLFNGEEITIKSDLINRHVLDKNFIKFKTLRLELECSRNLNSSLCEDDLLRGILNNFKIEITHSGYSYHSWNGETVVTVSDEVTFDYSLKIYKNGEPEVYNSIIKKFENGDIILSPYTTWTIQLMPVNELANYTHLMSFVNDINLRLVGVGTFIPSPV